MNENKSHFVILLLILLIGGIFVHWREFAGEVIAPRQSLSQLPEKIGEWQKYGDDQRFNAATEAVLRADDYLMRNYFLPANGRSGNVYIGFHQTQKTGATYHSPRNCLPGSGWTMQESEPVLLTAHGEDFHAARYLIENHESKMVMIYWYQGRGRRNADEYADKFFTVWDSISKRRSDGALVRIVTTINRADANGAAQADADAQNLARTLAENLNSFVPN